MTAQARELAAFAPPAAAQPRSSLRLYGVHAAALAAWYALYRVIEPAQSS